MSIVSRNFLASLYAVLRVVALPGILAYLAKQLFDGRSAFETMDADWHVAELSAAFILAILAYQLLFAAWIMMLRRTGFYRTGHLRVYARIWWLSYMYRYVPGKVLLITERARLGTVAGIPPAAGAAMPVLETLLAILAGCTVSLLATTFYTKGDRHLLLIILLLMACLVFVLPMALRWLTGRVAIRRRFPDLGAVSLGTQDILILVLPFLVHYLMLGASFFLLARNFYPMPWMALPGTCGVYALAHVLSLLVVIAPAGLGIREGALAVQLEQAIPPAIASALAIGVRVWFTVAELACLGAVLFICRRRYWWRPGPRIS